MPDHTKHGFHYDPALGMMMPRGHVKAPAAAGGSGWSVIAEGENNSGAQITLNTSGADLIILVTSYYNGGGPSAINDNQTQTNAWASVTSYSDPSFGWGAIWYTWNAVTNASHQIGLTGASFPSFYVLAVSGSQTSSDPLDQSANNGGQGASSTASAGSITPTATGSLGVVGYAQATEAQSSPSVDNGYTLSNWISYGGGSHVGGGLCYNDSLTTSAINPTVTLGASSTYVSAGHANFLAA